MQPRCHHVSLQAGSLLVCSRGGVAGRGEARSVQWACLASALGPWVHNGARAARCGGRAACLTATGSLCERQCRYTLALLAGVVVFSEVPGHDVDALGVPRGHGCCSQTQGAPCHSSAWPAGVPVVHEARHCVVARDRLALGDGPDCLDDEVALPHHHSAVGRARVAGQALAGVELHPLPWADGGPEPLGVVGVRGAVECGVESAHPCPSWKSAFFLGGGAGVLGAAAVGGYGVEERGRSPGSNVRVEAARALPFGDCGGLCRLGWGGRPIHRGSLGAGTW
mmetsp:Transcript_18382/g.45127  ORF Transcript_18382/g.45127 Transcript_18382/m.45127 type:complete len:281 (-) Transcript_18382:157-999(-)